jgi:hypothetical protein
LQTQRNHARATKREKNKVVISIINQLVEEEKKRMDKKKKEEKGVENVKKGEKRKYLNFFLEHK